MDETFLEGIARPRIEEALRGCESAAKVDAAEALMESLRAEVKAARG